MRLSQRRALVTGGSSGIGDATCRRLARDGAAVAVNYHGGQERADDIVDAIRREGGRAVALQADVADEASVQSMFAAAEEALGGPIDLLVNNAGVEQPFSLVDMPLDEWNRVLATNLTGSFLCAREAARALMRDGRPGVIVNVSSVHEVIPWKQFSHYCASKGGLKLFGQSIARELAPHGIRVVQVAPGAIATPINQEMLDDQDARREVESEIPWGRIGHVDEVAGAISWIASDEAEYVVGSTLFVDGGMTLYPRFV